ncbi:MAG TPA: penicillin-binding protein 2 [Ignavibacteriaceae bacterium]|nr:penicillin-binding protein 2 [Ignavibacteriaceae bacterium]
MIPSGFGSAQRKSVIFVIISATFTLLIFRLFQMQIINYKEYDEQSANNSIKAIEQVPLRGVFLDRNGTIVVSNIPAYTLRITPADYDRSLNKIIENVIDVDPGYIDKILYNNRIYSKYIPIRIKRGIDFKTVSWLEENSEFLPGVDYIVEMQRGYPAGIMGSHMFGYNKEISPGLLKKENEYYDPGDYIGYNGIEKAYEKYLRGEKGYNYVLVDSRRKEIGRFKNGSADLASIKGDDLVLGIDADVQRAGENAFREGGYRGAFVAIEPKTGEVIALGSFPDYDLNQFSYVTTKEFLNYLYTDKDKPLFNRATMSMKPPGSTFKLMEAASALDLGVITTSNTFYCGGGFTFGRFFKCDGVHGSLNVIHAIEKSCNTFFYNLIYKIGLDNWYSYAKRFGFSEKTGIDIGEEAKGFIPNSKYYEKIYGPNWPRSIMASLGIGQGEVSVTPIQLAKYVSIIANDGVTYAPHIVKGYLDNKTKEFVPFKFDKIDVGIDKKVLDIVKEGMFLVVNGAGTAGRIRSTEIQIAGKTGTAQNPHGKDHALFIGFAPFDNPKIAVAVVVENVGFGATYAAPIARKMIDAYLLKGRIKENEENKYEQKLQPNIIGASLEN